MSLKCHIARSMSNQLGYNLSTRLDDIANLDYNILKAGKLISKEEIKPVFLRLDSEFADKQAKKSEV